MMLAAKYWILLLYYQQEVVGTNVATGKVKIKKLLSEGVRVDQEQIIEWD